MTVSKNSDVQISDVENQLIKDDCADSHSYIPATSPSPKMTMWKNSDVEICDDENQTIKDDSGADSQSPNSVVSRIKQMIENFWSKITISLPKPAYSSFSAEGGDRSILFYLTMIVALPLYAISYGMLYLAGHRFVEKREKFTEIYRMYSRSHFILGLEFIVLLSVCQIYGPPAAGGKNSKDFVRFGFSVVWFLVISWIYAPLILNPSGFDYVEVEKDWADWSDWMSGSVYEGCSANLCLESWLDEQQKHHDGFCGRLCEIILSLRFFVYGYIVMYMLRVGNNDRSIIGYSLSWSWLVIVALMIIFKIVSICMEKLFNLDFGRTCKILQVLTVFVIALFIMFFPCLHLTVGDVFSCLLVFLPTGWALLEIARAWRPLVEGLRMWEIVKVVSVGYEAVMGTLIFKPLDIVATILHISQLHSSPHSILDHYTSPPNQERTQDLGRDSCPPLGCM